MRELIYYVATSLDGRIAAPDGDFSAFPVTGDHIDMVLEEWTDTLPAPALAALGLTPPATRFDAVVMGWRTYPPASPTACTTPTRTSTRSSSRDATSTPTCRPGSG